ncbi:MAG: DUF3667 domain-containing protein [Saprospiraceae bacterium]|nr:DUF3667 domain-containing protein [Saprospiraceae bacterium]
MSICQNCETAFEGKFCHQCGQKANVKRITFRSVFSDLIKKITFWDKGLMYTTVRLLKSPGKMARGYLNGHRVNFTKPLNYILIVVAVSVLVFPRKDLDQAMSGIAQNSRALTPGYMDWVFSNISLIYLMMIPMLAVVSKWFNRKADVNYAEHFVFYCYLMAGCTIITIPFTIVSNIFHINALTLNPLGIVQYACWFLFFAWGYVQFFNKQHKYWGGIQGVLVLLIAYILYILAFSILFAIAIALAKILFHIDLIPLAVPAQ